MSAWGWALWLSACGGGAAEPVPEVPLPEAETTAGTFAERYAERWCRELQVCNPGSTCHPEDVDAGNDTACAFELENAEACMDAEWPCVGQEDARFPEVPLVCSQVYACG